MSKKILCTNTATITELKSSPIDTVSKGKGSVVAILKRNEPAFYCVPPELFAYYLELAEDAALNRTADERLTSPQSSIKLSLDDL